jgi:hypothetical protein
MEYASLVIGVSGWWLTLPIALCPPLRRACQRNRTLCTLVLLFLACAALGVSAWLSYSVQAAYIQATYHGSGPLFWPYPDIPPPTLQETLEQAAREAIATGSIAGALTTLINGAMTRPKRAALVKL